MENWLNLFLHLTGWLSWNSLYLSQHLETIFNPSFIALEKEIFTFFIVLKFRKIKIFAFDVIRWTKKCLFRKMFKTIFEVIKLKLLRQKTFWKWQLTVTRFHFKKFQLVNEANDSSQTLTEFFTKSLEILTTIRNLKCNIFSKAKKILIYWILFLK